MRLLVLKLGNSPVDQVVSELQYVKGVGPRLAKSYEKLGIRTPQELLEHFPRRYEDRSKLPKIASIRPGQQVTVRGYIRQLDYRPSGGRSLPIKATLHDGTGSVQLVWFNQPWIAKKLRDCEGEIIAFGTVKEGRYSYEIASPEFEVLDAEDDGESFARIVPIYPATDGLNQGNIRKAVSSVMEKLLPSLQDFVPSDLRRKFGLGNQRECIARLHHPESLEDVPKARRRLVFDEFLVPQVVMAQLRASTHRETGIAFDFDHSSGGLFSHGEIWEDVAKMLPFELTGAQRRVVNEIWDDMRAPFPMHRLVQGDVGSGKTAVAACAILAAVRAGYQAALMAPTEILAEQHAAGLKRFFHPIGIEVELVMGKQNAKARKKSLDKIANGEALVVVGTHALIEETVKFHRFGLGVIDEQHRFGVKQRQAIKEKSEIPPDILVMTATPIPRTMAMAFYGDLDKSVIDELPPGRKPIKTHWKRTNERQSVYEGVRKLVQEGRQAYVVCPLIEESEKMQAQAATDLFYRLKGETFPEFRVGLLHGQMKPAEKEAVMEEFRDHKLDILVSTVVIEVGVDVKNASVMVIEDANRFGLSQLHQIRGRVGRGEHASYCILVADATTPDAEERMKIMVETQDGFRLAEEDLRIRGPGDLMGTKQSGQVFKIADLIRDAEILEDARKAAAMIVSSDPSLEKSEHALLRPRVEAAAAQRESVAIG